MDGLQMVTSKRRIGLHYLRGAFVIDLLAVIPYEVCYTMFDTGEATRQATNGALQPASILADVRLFQLFTSEHYNTELPFTSEHPRSANYTVVLAVDAPFRPRRRWRPGWAAVHESVGDSQFERYAVSIYWAIITMTTVGYGTCGAASRWIAVKDDATSWPYREKSPHAADYITSTNIPAGDLDPASSRTSAPLCNEKASDTEVLSIFPATLRRNILRYIYKGRLQSSYLYQGCSIKFLDLLVAAASFDLFMPQLDLVKYGKLVTELMMLIEGEMTCHDMEGAAQRADDDSGGGGGGVDGGDGPRAGTMYAVREGELIGEVAFFTEEPAQETLSTITVCRVMVISRMAWIGILERHSSGAEVMLENLSRGMAEALGGSADSSAQAGAPDEPSAQAAPANVEATEAKGSTAAGRWSSAHRSLGGAMPRKASFHEAPSSPVTSAPSVFGIYNQDQAERTGEMLGSSGTCWARASPSTGRTTPAEPRSSSRIAQERTVALQTLLRAGAKVNLTARGYGTPLFLCVPQRRQRRGLDMLLAFHAPLGLTEAERASELCRAVLDGDIRMLRRLMRCGVDPAAKGYDSRTALHVARGRGLPCRGGQRCSRAAAGARRGPLGRQPSGGSPAGGETLAMVASLEAACLGQGSLLSELLSE
eukprot:jgi/Tetstr1/429298/TSEL_019216.t1